MSRDQYDVLGEQVLQQMAVGFDWGGLVKGTANVVDTGLQQKAKSDAEAKAKHDSEAAVEKSRNADMAWANAEANLELAGADATSSAAAKVIRDTKEADAIAAAAALQGDGNDKRCSAAKDALNDAAKAASADPKNVAKAAKLRAWQKVVDACSNSGGSSGGAAAADSSGGGGGGGSDFMTMLTTKRAGLPTWGWVGIGVGGLGALLLLLRKKRG